MTMMNPATARHAAVLCVLAPLMLAGCEESTGAASDGASQYQGEAQSQLGRTAEMGRDLADQIAGRDAQLGTAAAQAMGDAALTLPGLDITPPSGWTQVEPANAMRLAEFDADGATVTFSQMGGSVEANIDRWLGQIVTQNGAPADPESRESRDIAGFPAQIVETYGAYLEGGMMGTPTRREAFGLIGAVIDTGATKTFIKMTGPDDVVSEQREAFDQLLSSIRRP